MQNIIKLNSKKLGLKAFVFLAFSLSLVTSSNLCLCKADGHDLKKIATFSCAVLNGYVNKVKEFIDSGANITEINNTGSSSTSLIYDALFIKNEAIRNKIINMLLNELLKNKYKNVKEDYLNNKNYRNNRENPATALEKSFSFGYLDISEKLILAGASCDDSDDCELNIFYGQVMLEFMKKKAAGK